VIALLALAAALAAPPGAVGVCEGFDEAEAKRRAAHQGPCPYCPCACSPDRGVFCAPCAACVEPEMPVPPPIWTTAAQIRAADGQIVTPDAVYEPRPSRRRKPRPGRDEPAVDLGFVALRLEGPASELHDGGAPDAPARLDLGATPRSAEEIAALSGRRVRITGRVVLEPPTDRGVAGPRSAPRLVPTGAPRPLDP
jgi:hypothetical protein